MIAALWCVSCMSSDEAATPENVHGVSGVDATISFNQKTTLALKPNEITDLTVTGVPPAPYAVSFFLVGNALDASLDTTNAIADKNGVATVRLRAPNSSTNFVVRATIKDGPSAELAVAVSSQGFGQLNITPRYDGDRPVETWVASVTSGTNCDAVAELLPEELPGALTGAASPNEPLLINTAPVGPNLTVAIRAGHYLWGCSDEPDLMAGDTMDVEVTVLNRPIDVSNTKLDVALEFLPDSNEWETLLNSQQEFMLAQFGSSSETASQNLLSEMIALATDPAAMDTAADSNNWQDTLANHLDTKMVDLAGDLAQLATTGLAAQSAIIEGGVDTQEQEPGSTLFKLSQLGSVPVTSLGVDESYLMALTVDPDDTVRLSGEFDWLPSRYIGAAIEQAATSQYPSHNEFGETLAAIAFCDELILAGSTSCQGSCISALCRSALESIWLTALDSSANTIQTGTVAIQAAGPAQFDDQANLTGFSGMWVGSVVSLQLSAGVQGSVTATLPDPPSEPAP